MDKDINEKAKRQIERLLIIADDSLTAIETQTKKMREENPYIYPPPDEMLRIANVIAKITDINYKL